MDHERSNGEGKPRMNDHRKRSPFRQKWQDADYRRKIYHSVTICGCIFILGCMMSQRGATFLDLQIVTDTNFQKASAFLTSGGLGYLSGTLLCGIVFGKVNANLMLFTCGMLVGVINFAIPFCSNYVLMIIISFLTFFVASFFDTGCNALLISLWGTECEQWMQCLHLSFAVGGVMSPLYTEPFLAPGDADNGTLADEASLNMTANSTSNSSSLGFSHHYHNQETNVKYAYMITSACIISLSLPFLFFYFMTRGNVEQRKEEDARNPRKLPVAYMSLIMMMLSAFLMCYSSVELTFSSLLMTFMVREYESVSKSKGAFMMALYWAAFAGGRFLNVFLSKALPLSRQLAMCMALMLITYTGFLISAQHAVIHALVVFTVMAGLSMSGVYATVFSWTEVELIKVNGFRTGVIIFSSALAGMINPLILGYLMERVGNMCFCYLLLGMTILTASFFALILVFARKVLDRKFGPCRRSSSITAVVSREPFIQNDQQTKLERMC